MHELTLPALHMYCHSFALQEWATTAFKEYNFESAGKEAGGGHVHALMKVREG